MKSEDSPEVLIASLNALDPCSSLSLTLKHYILLSSSPQLSALFRKTIAEGGTWGDLWQSIENYYSAYGDWSYNEVALLYYLTLIDRNHPDSHFQVYASLLLSKSLSNLRAKIKHLPAINARYHFDSSLDSYFQLTDKYLIGGNFLLGKIIVGLKKDLTLTEIIEPILRGICDLRSLYIPHNLEVVYLWRRIKPEVCPCVQFDGMEYRWMAVDEEKYEKVASMAAFEGRMRKKGQHSRFIHDPIEKLLHKFIRRGVSWEQAVPDINRMLQDQYLWVLRRRGVRLRKTKDNAQDSAEGSGVSHCKLEEYSSYFCVKRERPKRDEPTSVARGLNKRMFLLYLLSLVYGIDNPKTGRVIRHSTSRITQFYEVNKQQIVREGEVKLQAYLSHKINPKLSSTQINELIGIIREARGARGAKAESEGSAQTVLSEEPKESGAHDCLSEVKQEKSSSPLEIIQASHSLSQAIPTDAMKEVTSQQSLGTKKEKKQGSKQRKRVQPVSVAEKDDLAWNEQPPPRKRVHRGPIFECKSSPMGSASPPPPPYPFSEEQKGLLCLLVSDPSKTEFLPLIVTFLKCTVAQATRFYEQRRMELNKMREGILSFYAQEGVKFVETIFDPRLRHLVRYHLAATP